MHRQRILDIRVGPGMARAVSATFDALVAFHRACAEATLSATMAEAERYLAEARAHLERADGALTAIIPTLLETAEREGSTDHLPAMRAFIERRCRSVNDAKRRFGMAADTCRNKFSEAK